MLTRKFMEEVPFNRFCISGTLLASILQGAICGQSGNDGVLFGSLIKKTVTLLQDNTDEPIRREESTASASGYFGERNLMSFYDSAGRIDAGKLLNLMENRSRKEFGLLGWFIVRSNSVLRPSMRETAVSVNLRKNLAHGDSSGPPLFLLKINFTTTEYNSIQSYEFRAFQCLWKQGRYSFKSVPVQVTNIGPEFRQHYDAFSPLSPFPPIKAFLPSPDWNPNGIFESSGSRAIVHNSMGNVPEEFNLAKLENVAGRHAASQVRSVEELYESLLQKLEVLISQDEITSEAVQKLVILFILVKLLNFSLI